MTTGPGLAAIFRPEISIHVTAKVTTETVQYGKTEEWNFNPRHREGDDGQRLDWEENHAISIHVTAKVTTGLAPIA